MRDTFVKTLIDIAKKDKNVVLITGDLGFGVLKPFWEQLPDQFINAGIAEQNMTSMAAGLALEGKIVYTYSIANFPTLRCLEQIRNDCAYHNANVKIVCVGGGFAYGSLGMSHHATEDIAIMRALPNVTVYAPGDLSEAEAATWAIYHTSGTCYLRLGRGGESRLHGHVKEEEVRRAILCHKGKNIALFSTGAIADEAMKAIEALHEHGMDIAYYTFPCIKPVDKETIHEIANDYREIVTLEEQNTVGGFGSSVCEVVGECKKVKPIVQRIGINDEYCSLVGGQGYLRKKLQIDSRSIFKFLQSEFLSL